MSASKAILLLAHGAPSSLDDIPRILTQIRKGRPYSQEFLEEVTNRYKQIGDSPLVRITQSLGQKLSTHMQIPVYIGMKYGDPSIQDALLDMLNAHVKNITAIVLAPHYSELSIGAYEKFLHTYLDKLQYCPTLQLIRHWHTSSLLIKFWAEEIQKLWQENTHVLFSAHSLPAFILENQDPYIEQVTQTANLIAQKLKLSKSQYSVCFQSEANTGQPWLSPTIQSSLEQASKNQFSHLISAPIGFCAEHVEVLYDIDIELQKIALQNNLALSRAKMPNDQDSFVKILENELKLHT